MFGAVGVVWSVLYALVTYALPAPTFRPRTPSEYVRLGSNQDAVVVASITGAPVLDVLTSNARVDIDLGEHHRIRCEEKV